MNNKLIEELSEKFYQFREKHFDKISDEDWDLLEKSWFLNLLEEKYFNQSYNNIILYKQHQRDNFKFAVLNYDKILDLKEGNIYYDQDINKNNYFFITENQKRLIKKYIGFKEWLLNENISVRVELNREVLKFIQNTSEGYLTNALKYLNYTQQNEKFTSLINEFKKYPDSLNIKRFENKGKTTYEVLCLKTGNVTTVSPTYELDKFKLEREIDNTREVVIKCPQRVEGFLNFNKKEKIELEHLKQTKDWKDLCEYAKNLLSREYDNVFINKKDIKIELLDVQQIFKDQLNINEFNKDKNIKLSVLDNLKYEDIEKCLIKEILPIDKPINNLEVNKWFGLKYLGDSSISLFDNPDYYSYQKAFILLKTNKNDFISFLSVTREKDNEKIISINAVSTCEQFRGCGFSKMLYQTLLELVKENNFIVKRDLGLITESGKISIKNVDFTKSTNIIEFKYNEKEFKGFKDILNNSNYYLMDFLKYGKISDESFSKILQLQNLTHEMDCESIYLTDKSKRKLLEDFKKTIEYFDFARENSNELNLEELLKEVIKQKVKLQIKALLQKENNEKKQKLTI